MDRLAQAQRLSQAGRLRDAAAVVSEVLKAQPRNAEAMRLLAEIQFQTGYRREALKLAERATQEDPENGKAWNTVGLICHLSGHNERALQCFEQATKASPGLGEAWTNLGFVLQALGRHAEAIDALRHVQPASPQALFFLGNSHADLAAHRDAVAAFDSALALAPQMAEAWNNRGTSMLQLGLAEAAVDSLQRAFALEPGNATYRGNFASALHRVGRSEEALNLLEQAADAHTNHVKAEILADLGQYAEAAELLRAPLPNSLALLARIRQSQGRWREAIDVLASSSAPAHRLLSAVILPTILDAKDTVIEARSHMAAELESASENGGDIANPLQDVGQTTFFLAYHGIGERELQVQTSQTYRKLCPSLRFEAAHTPGRHGRIRVGILSAFLHEHTIGRLFTALFSRLDRDTFEVSYLQLGPVDAYTQSLASRSDRHTHLPTSLREAMTLVAEQSLDILIYPEVGMAPQTYYMALARLAPVQCVLWGHPMTTGSPTMDYFISSRDLEAEGAESEYSERLVRLPTLTTYFERPPNPPLLTQDAFGLPAGRRLYGCLQTLFKFHPDFDRVLAAILDRDPHAVLVLLRPKVSEWETLLVERWRKSYPILAERSVFLPPQSRERYLALSALCDAILDPIQFGGGNSSLECFGVGAPVVTLPGQLLRNRITTAAYLQMGMADLIAEDEQAYVDRAVRLANDEEWRHEMRGQVAARSSPLFENLRAVSDLSDFLVSVRP